MIFLLLHIVFGSAFMLSIKWVHVRNKEDVITVGCLNYILAAILIAPEFWQMPAEHVTRNAMLTGGTMGLAYFICFFFVIYAIKWIGASSTTVIAVLAIIVPISFGVFFWGEDPNPVQIAGIVLALLSLSLIGAHEDHTLERSKHPWWLMPVALITLFALCGISRLAQEAYKHMCEPQERPAYLFTAFAIAAVPSIIVLIARRKRITPSEIMFALLMGGSNILQTHFLLRALDYMDGFIVFPVASAGGMIFTVLVATRYFGERLTRQTWIGISIAAVALVMLNWLPAANGG
ncbi:MAG: EamA family transporter [Pirellulaceae bacterium]